MNQLEEIKIENLIYEIRGKQVMLDSDLAKLYGCKNGTKDINKAVNRNLDRFPEDFYFQLTKQEYENLKFQSGTSSNNHGGVRKLPYVFTEQGVAMLSSVLRTSIASNVSIKIMRCFVNLRKYISNYEFRISNIETKIIDYDNKFDKLFEILDKTKNNHIFFEGQIYDVYSLLLDIFETSKESIIIIDNYADKKLLDLLSKTKKNVKVYSKNINDDLINKYKKQYSNVELIECNSFHDRFIIIDNKHLYHSGASFKELGKKCFALNKIEDEKWLNEILLKIVS